MARCDASIPLQIGLAFSPCVHGSMDPLPRLKDALNTALGAESKNPTMVFTIDSRCHQQIGGSSRSIYRPPNTWDMKPVWGLANILHRRALLVRTACRPRVDRDGCQDSRYSSYESCQVRRQCRNVRTSKRFHSRRIAATTSSSPSAGKMYLGVVWWCSACSLAGCSAEAQYLAFPANEVQTMLQPWCQLRSNPQLYKFCPIIYIKA